MASLVIGCWYTGRNPMAVDGNGYEGTYPKGDTGRHYDTVLGGSPMQSKKDKENWWFGAVAAMPCRRLSVLFVRIWTSCG